MMKAMTPDIAELRTAAARHGRWLQYVTIAWNSLECLVALIAGFLAGSVALVGFGFDSAIEVASSLAALWRLRWDADEARREAAERHTLRIIGGCFLLLAAYVAYGAIRAWLERGAPEAEARQTRICAYLSAILLAGLGLNAWLGWWWADPAAGLLMVPLIAWEGWEAVRGRTCCD